MKKRKYVVEQLFATTPVINTAIDPIDDEGVTITKKVPTRKAIENTTKTKPFSNIDGFFLETTENKLKNTTNEKKNISWIVSPS